MNESLAAEALRRYDEVECVCGRMKGRGRSFCPKCYFTLPKGIRIAVAKERPGTDEYAAAWDEARDWLRINK